MFCRNWQSSDRILIFTTDGATEKNWSPDGHKDGCEGLESRLQRLNLPAPVSRKRIPEGKSEAEIWEIFSIIENELQSGDNVVFDITHAFRSIPMLAIVVLHYAKAIKNVALKGIYYGALEALGSLSYVESLPLDKRRVPIFDLTSFSNLLDWSLAIDRFLGAGDASLACSLAGLESSCAAPETSVEDQPSSEMAGIATSLARFSKALATCRGPEIGPAVASLREEVKLCAERTLPPPFIPLLDRVRSQMSVFDGDEIHDGIRAAKWCLDHNLIQQGYTILQEFIITFLTKSIGRKTLNLYHRTIAAQSIKIFKQSLPEDTWKGAASENPAMTKSFLEYLKERPQLAEVYEELSPYRNDLNHAGFREQKKQKPFTSEDFTRELDELIKKVENAIV
jgi:CRISPR-associated Csx2 family protein